MTNMEVLDMSRASTFQLPPLDQYQKKVVESLDDNICVIADPATGKTNTVHAFVLELLNRGVSPDDIAAFTFTRTGATVMNDRFGIFVKATTQHAHGWRKSKASRDIFTATGNFDDLLHPRRPSEKYYEWVLCDEGQDLTPLQYENFLSWGKHHFLVGDPWQSLFAYPDAGADPTLLDRFCEDFHIEHKPLRINHRSSKAVIEVANAFSGRSTEPAEEAVDGRVRVGNVIPDLHNLTILARSKREARSYSDMLFRRSIDHTHVESTSNKSRVATNWINKQPNPLSRLEDKPENYLSTIVQTVHLSKGDEWDRVWLINWDSPYQRLEECAFYVGLTRAKLELYVFALKHTAFTRRLT